MKNEFRNKTDRTTALTLAEQDLVLHRDFVRSPRRGKSSRTFLDDSDTCRGNPALRYVRRWDRIHPLLGERAGVREDVKPFVMRSLNKFRLAAKARSVMDCGGKRRATPLSTAGGSLEHVTPAESAVAAPALPAQSKTWRSFVVLLGFILLHSAFCLRVSGQSYSIDWYKVSGGGGTSTGGPVIGTNYSVSGTIGQHDAGGPMTGGNFSLTGGFWSLYAVQTPGAPVLSIKLTTTNTAQVYWPSPSTGWNLQVNTNLVSTNWVTPAESVTDNGTIKFIIVNPPSGNRFYRLKNP